MPRFSILTPVFNTPIWALERCISSVLEQTCEDWELILVDDSSSSSEIKPALERLSAIDKRIRVNLREENGGISVASQTALDLAIGEFIVLLDHDDELAPSALEKMESAICINPEVDYLYSDEDKISPDGQRFDTFLKPDWSPERLRGQNYCCHLSVIRTQLAREVGGFRKGFDGSQDYDLILRVSEVARAIHHVPEVLYHWRVLESSTALKQSAKPYAYEAATKALEEHLARSGISGRVIDAGFGYHRILRTIKDDALISVVIPTCGTSKTIFGQQTCLLLNAISSIINRSSYPNFEIITVADAHTPNNVLESLKLMSDSRVRIVIYNKPFNFSDKCNVGAIEANGDYILLLNDDVEVISSDWMETLLGHAQEDNVGMVGPMLLLENGLIQSASHSNTPSPHNFRNGELPHEPGEFGVLAIARECSGITGAAALLKKSVYTEVGGLSVQFPNCFNDVDLAFKVLDAGYRIIWTPHARLFHFESVSRNPNVNEEEIRLLKDRWGRFFNNDRFLKLI